MMLSTFEINPRGRHRALAQPHHTGNAGGLSGMAHMNKLRCRSKCSQITAGVYDSTRNSIILQCLDSAINRKPFGNASKIDNHRPPKKDFAILAQKNISPAGCGVKTVTATRKIMPTDKLRCDGNIKRAVAFPRKISCRFHDLPRPRMHDD